MKYIRTKDDIIDFEKVEIVDREIGTPKTITYLKKNAIKQANTIEELCDVYIIEKFKHIFTIDEFSKNLVRNCKDSKVYGAIWTDKGLIYVAKMNDKGELELL